MTWNEDGTFTYENRTVIFTEGESTRVFDCDVVGSFNPSERPPYTSFIDGKWYSLKKVGPRTYKVIRIWNGNQ